MTGTTGSANSIPVAGETCRWCGHTIAEHREFEVVCKCGLWWWMGSERGWMNHADQPRHARTIASGWCEVCGTRLNFDGAIEHYREERAENAD